MSAIERILQLRRAFAITCAMADVSSRDSGMAAVDEIVETYGFRGLAARWIEVSAADAHAIVTALLHRDLAYGAELMSQATACALATQLFDAVPEPHAYFTNGEWIMSSVESAEAKLRSWNPISEATFDSGVICLGQGRAAILWIQDED